LLNSIACEKIKELKRLKAKTKGKIEGNTMEPGMYLYTLIADGKEVDTKKMILTK